MITEERIQEGATHLSDGKQLTYVIDGSDLERIWRNWDKYLALLSYEEAPDSDKLASFIRLSRSVSYFYWEREWSAGFTPASRRDHLLSLATSLQQAVSGLRRMDARTAELLDDDIYHVFGEDDGVCGVAGRLEILQKKILGFGQDEAEIKIGNNIDTGLQDLIANLVLIFEACSLKKASKPYQRASKKLAYDEPPYDGPFYRFCHAVMAEIEPASIPKLPHAIRTVLKTGR